MPSILSDYEYDIFISYRQKDNQYDGWVTRFVEDLKKELEATLKNQVSVYFDANPHDGLLETHHVDESLNKKLKCLVLIPIISQTYCDESCFAWQYELIPFLNSAREDRFGLNIPLGNGNVASRVLPVQIHELDEEDKLLYENTIDSKLRAIEFIYKEPGVNRPLNSSDNEEKNQNQTSYRNQINKVANALKEIGTALIRIDKGEMPTEVRPEVQEVLPSSQSLFKNKWVMGVLAIAALALAYFFYSGRTETSQIEAIPELEKSIAVLAFENMSNDPEQEYFSDGISEEIINALTKVKGLRVAGRTSSFYFKNKDEDFKSIAEKLNVAMILEGSVRRSGDQLRITTQLIDAATGFHLWSENFDGTLENIFDLQDRIARLVSEKMELTMTDQGEKEYQPKREAYELYLKGIFHWNKRGRDLLKARDYFLQSVEIDSTYALAYAALSSTHALMLWYEVGSPIGIPELAVKYGEKAIQLDEDLGEGYAALGLSYLFGFWDIERADELFAKGYFLDSAYAPAAYWRSMTMVLNSKIDEAQELATKASKIDPLSPIALDNLALALRRKGRNEEALQVSNRALDILPNENSYNAKYTALYELKRFNEANETLDLAIELFGRKPLYIIQKAFIFKAMDSTADISDLVRELEELKKVENEYVTDGKMAAIHFMNGDLGVSKEYLHKAFENRDTRLIFGVFDEKTEGNKEWLQFIRGQYDSPRATIRPN